MGGMAAVVERLSRVSEAEYEAKRAALRAVRDAFVFRAPHGGPRAGNASRPRDYRPGYAPSAVDFILGELCEAARSAKHNGTLTTQPLAGGSYSRCML